MRWHRLHVKARLQVFEFRHFRRTHARFPLPQAERQFGPSKRCGE